MKMKKCANCGQILDDLALKCKNCKAYVDNETFQCLCDDDIRLIKSEDLTIFTPSLVSFMLSEPITKDLQSMVRKSESKTISFNEIIFCSYCYSSTVNIHANKKAGKNDLLKEQTNIELLSNAISCFSTMLKAPVKKDRTDKRIKWGLDLYKQFDEVLHDPTTVFPREEHFVEAQVITATEIGKVVYKQETLLKGIELFLMWVITEKHFEDIFSQYFLVEEKDFNWKIMLNSPRAKRALKNWETRFYK